MTWDRHKIVELSQKGKSIGIEVLKTDEEFANHSKYEKIMIDDKREECITNIKELMSEKVKNKVQENLGIQIQSLLKEKEITTSEMVNQAHQIQATQQVEQEQHVDMNI